MSAFSIAKRWVDVNDVFLLLVGIVPLLASARRVVAADGRYETGMYMVPMLISMEPVILRRRGCAVERSWQRWRIRLKVRVGWSARVAGDENV